MDRLIREYGPVAAIAAVMLAVAIVRTRERQEPPESGTPTNSRPAPTDLIGQCAYNPSDMKYLGPVIAVGPDGYNSAGQPDPGQRAVTVLHPEGGPVMVTYPRYLIVRPC